MSKELDCGIVRDLLPTYLDGQTSESTNAAVEGHLAGCQACRELYLRMKEPEKQEASEQHEEIDYLKKVKRTGLRRVGIAVAATAAAALIIALLWIFLHGVEADPDAHAVNARVVGNEVIVDVMLSSSGEAARLAFTDEGGKLYGSVTAKDIAEALEKLGITVDKRKIQTPDPIKAYGTYTVDVKLYTMPVSPLNWHGTISRTYTVKNGPVRAVTAGGRLLWEDGEAISVLAGRLYAAKNKYVGSMPGNQRVANVLGLTERYGYYVNALQTAEEPYGWELILQEPIDVSQEERYRAKMRADACLLLASVENLGRVTFRYNTTEGTAAVARARELTLTAERASEIIGEDIKSFAASAAGLQRLIEDVR